jgi:hypothetical protein
MATAVSTTNYARPGGKQGGWPAMRSDDLHLELTAYQVDVVTKSPWLHRWRPHQLPERRPHAPPRPRWAGDWRWSPIGNARVAQWIDARYSEAAPVQRHVQRPGHHRGGACRATRRAATAGTAVVSGGGSGCRHGMAGLRGSRGGNRNDDVVQATRANCLAASGTIIKGRLSALLHRLPVRSRWRS